MFICKRQCPTCDTNHMAFQVIRQGMVILGNQYAPVMVGSNRKCILVLRIVNTTFKELINRFSHLIKTKAWCNDNSGENFTPGLMIVSLPCQLMNLGLEGYIHNFF